MGIAYNPKINTSGLLAYYDAANSKSWTGSGSWKDLSGNGNDLPNNGSVTTSTLGGATAMNFNSDGKFFENTTAFSGTSPTTNATLEAWIYPAASEITSGDRGTIIRIHGGSGHYLSWNKSNRKMSAYWYNHTDGSTSAGYHETGAAMAREQWHHLAQVWNYSDQKLYQFTNGVKTQASTYGTGSANTVIEVGRESSGRQFAGGIAIIKIHNTALTDAQVLQAYNALKGRFS